MQIHQASPPASGLGDTQMACCAQQGWSMVHLLPFSTCEVSFSIPSLPSFSSLFVYIHSHSHLESILMFSRKYFSIKYLCLASNLFFHFWTFFAYLYTRKKKERPLRWPSGKGVSAILRTHTIERETQLVLAALSPHTCIMTHVHSTLHVNNNKTSKIIRRGKKSPRTQIPYSLTTAKSSPKHVKSTMTEEVKWRWHQHPRHNLQKGSTLPGRSSSFIRDKTHMKRILSLNYYAAYF